MVVERKGCRGWTSNVSSGGSIGTRSWVSHSLLDRQIDRALLRDLLHAFQDEGRSERVNQLAD